MKNRLLILLALIVSFVTISGQVYAHHGSANYDMTATVTLKGNVTEFDFINPHAQIYFDVTGDNHAGEKWVAELDSPNMLARGGWTKSTLKPGDQVTISGHADKRGQKDLRLTKCVVPDGREFNDEGDPPKNPK